MILSPLKDTDQIKWKTKITQGCTLLPDGKINPDEDPKTAKWALDYYKQFGYTKGHIGIDFGCPVGTPVYATEHYDYIVVKTHAVGYGLHIEGYGCVKQKSGVRNMTRLAHLSKVVVSTGDTVNMGDLIGYSGNSGGTAPHLHLDMQNTTPKYETIDPKDGTLGRKFIDRKWLMWWE